MEPGPAAAMPSDKVKTQVSPARLKKTQPQHHRTYSTFSARSGSSKESLVRPAANVKPNLRMASSEDAALLVKQKLLSSLKPKAKQTAEIDLEANRSSGQEVREAIDWEKWLFLVLIAVVYAVCIGLLWQTQRNYQDGHGGCWWNCEHPEQEDGPTAA